MNELLHEIRVQRRERRKTTGRDATQVMAGCKLLSEFFAQMQREGHLIQAVDFNGEEYCQIEGLRVVAMHMDGVIVL